LALKKESHIDTVLFFRQQYLAARHKEENLKKFRELNQNIDVDWNNIKAKIVT